MTRDCAGLDEAEDSGDGESAGPGEGRPIGCCAEEGRRSLFSERGEVGPGRCLNDAAVLPALPTCAVVPEDEFRDTWGRPGGPKPAGPAVEAPGLGVSGAPPSFFGMGESFRMERDEGALVWPYAPWEEPVLLVASRAACESEPGTGDGAAELLAAAVALRI
jgi:hypothetical protein